MSEPGGARNAAPALTNPRHRETIMANGIISGTRVPRNFTLAQRLAFYSMPEPNSGCLLWLGHASGNIRWNALYGYLTWGGQSRGAHVWSWEEANGRPIPDGMEVCHKCDIGLCIEPTHLFLGDHGENMRDMAAKGRAGTQKLQVAQVLAIIKDPRKQTEIAAAYGISQAQVSKIKIRDAWKHVHGPAFRHAPLL